MQTSVEETGKLKRKLSVEVPLKDVTATYDEVFASISSHIRVDGFRPGKFPRKLAEKRFQSVMEQEATRTLLPKYFEEALKELDLRPATQPTFSEMEVNKTKPFKFVAEFEIVPSFDLPDAKSFKLDVKEPKVAKKEIDERVEEMRRQRSTLKDKGNEPAEKGDTVTLDYVGKIDDVAFEGGTGKGHKVELGAGQFLEDFEKPLPGMKAGESKTVKVVFPQDYDPKVAGQTAMFDITVVAVETHDLPELDKAFFSQFGELEDLKAFRDHVEKELISQQEQKIAGEYQQQLADQIKKTAKFDVPEGVIEQNLHQFEHQLSHDDPEALKDEKKLAKLKKEEAEKIESELRLSYIIDDWATKNGIEVDPNQAQQQFFMQAYMMRQNPAELVKTPYGEDMLYQIRRQMLATSVLDDMAAKALGKSTSSEKSDDEKKAAPKKAAKKADGADAGEEKESAGKKASTAKAKATKAE